MHVRFHRHLILLALTAAALLLAPPATSQERPQIRGGERGQPRERSPADDEPASAQPVPGVPESVEKLFQEIDEAALKEPFKREYKVFEGSTQKTPLLRADPKLLENKFAALIELNSTFRLNVDFRSPDRAQAQVEIQSLQRGFGAARSAIPKAESRILRDGDWLFGWHFGYRAESRSTRDSRSTRNRDPHSDYFKLLGEFCPRDRLPAQPMLDFLTGSDADRDVQWRVGGGDEGDRWELTVFAPTAKAAEERAAAILRLVDEGLCRSLQRDCLAEGRKALDAAHKVHDELVKLSQSSGELGAKLRKPSEISSEVLKELKSQKVMTDIELAGLTARVNACTAMLSKPKELSESAIETIGDMKVRAEIDRLGVKEKLDRINALVTEGNERELMQGKVLELYARSENLRREMDGHSRSAADYVRLLPFFAPLELKDNAIKVVPIEWTNN